MASNGIIKQKSDPSPRQIQVGERIARESSGFLVAEATSMLTSLGVVAVADKLIPAPLLDSASKVVSKVCILPFLNRIEKTLSNVCKLEECQTNENESREVRAERLARTLIIFSVSYIAAMEAKLHTRRHMNKLTGVAEAHPAPLPKGTPLWERIKHYSRLRHWSPEEKMIFAADEGVHYGALYLFNNQLSPFTDDMIRTTTDMLQKVTGVGERKAHEIATMAWIWEAPNALGAIAGIGAITGKHAKGWPKKWFRGSQPPATYTEKLAQEAVVTGSSIQTPGT